VQPLEELIEGFPAVFVEGVELLLEGHIGPQRSTIHSQILKKTMKTPRITK